MQQSDKNYHKFNNKKYMKDSTSKRAKSPKSKTPRLKQKNMKGSASKRTKNPKDKIINLKQKSMKDLTPQDIRSLKNKVHHLKPIVIVGNKGLTDTVIQEIDRALDDHELMKIRIHTQNREELTKNTTDICTKTNAILIHSIGHIIAIYRKNPDNEDN